MPDNPSVFGIRKVDIREMGLPVCLASNLLFYTTGEQERDCKKSYHRKTSHILKNLFHMFYLLPEDTERILIL